MGAFHSVHPPPGDPKPVPRACSTGSPVRFTHLSDSSVGSHPIGRVPIPRSNARLEVACRHTCLRAAGIYLLAFCGIRQEGARERSESYGSSYGQKIAQIMQLVGDPRPAGPVKTSEVFRRLRMSGSTPGSRPRRRRTLCCSGRRWPGRRRRPGRPSERSRAGPIRPPGRGCRC